jgi:soluble P-type ATPase
VTVVVPIPGGDELRLDHLMLDVNGTLTNRGVLIDGVEEQLDRLRSDLDIRLVSADTFGTLDDLAVRVGAGKVRASNAEDKLSALDALGRQGCAVIGNGANDVLVLEAAALGFAVLGPEGTSAAALRVADVVCLTTADALDLLLDPKALAFVAYSSIENSGLVVADLGLALMGKAQHRPGLMGLGLIAATFQITAHSFAKAGLFASVARSNATRARATSSDWAVSIDACRRPRWQRLPVARRSPRCPRSAGSCPSGSGSRR